MTFQFEVARDRESINKGSAIVRCNGQYICTYKDTIAQDGKHGKALWGWGSTVPDETFIANAMHGHANKIMATRKEVTASEDGEDNVACQGTGKRA